jgi:hypothetical protein
MSAALAHPVPAARREAPRPVRLRVVEVTPDRGRPEGRQRTEGRRVRRTAVPAVDGRGERGGLRAPAGPEAGVLLVPLGEVLVPVGRRPVLRVVPGGGALEVTCGRSADSGVGTVGAPVALPAWQRARPAGVAPRPAAGRSASGRGVGARRRRGSPRFRRAVVAVLAVLLAAGGARVVTVGEGGPVAAAAVPAAQQVVVVERGQTLWSLARELAPDADPREVVQRLQAANRLETAGLAVGQRLVLPAAR